jgi:predicted ABC-type ATPase
MTSDIERLEARVRKQGHRLAEAIDRITRLERILEHMGYAELHDRSADAADAASGAPCRPQPIAI